MTLSEVVREAEPVGAPDQLDAVTDPVVAHVDGSGALLLAGVVVG